MQRLGSAEFSRAESGHMMMEHTVSDPGESRVETLSRDPEKITRDMFD